MKKRKLNGKPIAIFILMIMIVISIFKIPAYNKHKALFDLGYSEEAIKAIIDKKLYKTFKENGYYSPLLNEAVIQDDFNMEYINLYLKRDSLSDDDKALYQALLSKYTKEELDYLFLQLEYDNLKPLLIFDYQAKPDTYIADITKNGLENLRHSYFEPYINVQKVSNPSSIDVLVNTRSDIADYVPELVLLSSTYSIDGVKVRPEVKEAFENKLCKAANDAGHRIYAIGGYVSYDTQYDLFDYYDLEEEAIEREVLKAGYNEKQTGLIIQITDVESAKGTNFKDSKAHDWLKEHAHEYGFIFRYPNEKTAITLKSDNSENTLRYLGVELATKVYESGLSYDEYIYYSDFELLSK